MQPVRLNKTHILKDIFKGKPREKLLELGPEALTLVELFAILLGSGNKENSVMSLAEKIELVYEGDLTLISRMTAKDYQMIKGIGPAKSISMVASFELARRKEMSLMQQKERITASKDVFLLFKPVLSDLPHEEFWVLFLNNGNHILKRKCISKGGITSTVVDVKIIMKFALQYLATSIILIHNHPSGTLKASEQDKIITNKIKSAAKLLEINILDHIIIAGNAYYSFADELLLA